MTGATVIVYHVGVNKVTYTDRSKQTSNNGICHLEGVRLITHLNIEFWERVTSGGTVHNDIMCLPVLILGLLQPLVPSRGLSGSFHSRGLTGFTHGSPGDPGDLTEIPSRQRHCVPFYKGEDRMPSPSSKREAFLFLHSLGSW